MSESLESSRMSLMRQREEVQLRLDALKKPDSSGVSSPSHPLSTSPFSRYPQPPASTTLQQQTHRGFIHSPTALSQRGGGYIAHQLPPQLRLQGYPPQGHDFAVRDYVLHPNLSPQPLHQGQEDGGGVLSPSSLWNDCGEPLSSGSRQAIVESQRFTSSSRGSGLTNPSLEGTTDPGVEEEVPLGASSSMSPSGAFNAMARDANLRELMFDKVESGSRGRKTRGLITEANDARAVSDALTTSSRSGGGLEQRMQAMRGPNSTPTPTTSGLLGTSPLLAMPQTNLLQSNWTLSPALSPHQMVTGGYLAPGYQTAAFTPTLMMMGAQQAYLPVPIAVVPTAVGFVNASPITQQPLEGPKDGQPLQPGSSQETLSTRTFKPRETLSDEVKTDVDSLFNGDEEEQALSSDAPQLSSRVEEEGISRLLTIPSKAMSNPFVSSLVNRQLEGLVAAKELKMETRRVILEGNLQRLQIKAQRESSEQAEDAIHSSWMAAQKRLVREAYVRKALASALGNDVASALSGQPIPAPRGAQLERPQEANYASYSEGVRNSGDVPPAAPPTKGSNAPPSSPRKGQEVREEEPDEEESNDPPPSAPPPKPPSPQAPILAAPSSVEKEGDAVGNALLKGPQPPHPYSWAPLPVYDEKSGMHIYFDFVAGLPTKATKIQVAFCFFVGAEQYGTVQAFGPLGTSLEPKDTEGAPDTLFTPVGMHRLIDGEAGEDVVMVVEVQRESTGGSQKSVGWCALPLFRGHVAKESAAKAAADVAGGTSAEAPQETGADASSTARGAVPQAPRPALPSGQRFTTDPTTGEVLFTPFARAIRLPLFKPPVDVKLLSLENMKKAVPLPGGVAAVYVRLVLAGEREGVKDFLSRTRGTLEEIQDNVEGGIQAMKKPAEAAAVSMGIPAPVVKVGARVLAELPDPKHDDDPDDPPEVVAAYRPNYAHLKDYVNHLDLAPGTKAAEELEQAPLTEPPAHKLAGPYEHPAIMHAHKAAKSRRELNEKAKEEARALNDRLEREYKARLVDYEERKRKSGMKGTPKARGVSGTPREAQLQQPQPQRQPQLQPPASTQSRFTGAATSPYTDETPSSSTPEPSQAGVVEFSPVSPLPLGPLEPFFGLEVESILLDLGTAGLSYLATSTATAHPLSTRIVWMCDGTPAHNPTRNQGNALGYGGLGGDASGEGKEWAGGGLGSMLGGNSAGTARNPSVNGRHEFGSVFTSRVNSMFHNPGGVHSGGSSGLGGGVSFGGSYPTQTSSNVSSVSLRTSSLPPNPQYTMRNEPGGGDFTKASPATLLSFVTAGTDPRFPAASHHGYRYLWNGMHGPYAPLLSGGVLSPSSSIDAGVLLAHFPTLPPSVVHPLGPGHLASHALGLEFIPASLTAGPPFASTHSIFSHATLPAVLKALIQEYGLGLPSPGGGLSAVVSACMDKSGVKTKPFPMTMRVSSGRVPNWGDIAAGLTLEDTSVFIPPPAQTRIKLRLVCTPPMLMRLFSALYALQPSVVGEYLGSVQSLFNSASAFSSASDAQIFNLLNNNQVATAQKAQQLNARSTNVSGVREAPKAESLSGTSGSSLSLSNGGAKEPPFPSEERLTDFDEGPGKTAPPSPPTPPPPSISKPPKVSSEAWLDVKPPPIESLPAFDVSQNGFGVYIDCARFLPDNVTITRLMVKIMNRDFVMCGGSVEGLCDIDAPLLCPRFGLAIHYLPPPPSGNTLHSPGVATSELSPDGSRVLVNYLVPSGAPLDASSTLVIRLETVESHTGALEVAGYSLMGLFQKHPATQALCLNAGAFQLPLFQSPPLKTLPLSFSSMVELGIPRVPCSTLLIRITALSESEVERGFASPPVEPPLLPFPPSYDTFSYASHLCVPSFPELQLYPKRAALLDASPISVADLLLHFQKSAEALQEHSEEKGGGVFTLVPTDGCAVDRDHPLYHFMSQELAGFGIPPNHDAGRSVLQAWIKKRLSGVPSSMLEYSYITPYDSSSGCVISFDGAHNLPEDAIMTRAKSSALAVSLNGPRSVLSASPAVLGYATSSIQSLLFPTAKLYGGGVEPAHLTGCHAGGYRHWEEATLRDREGLSSKDTSTSQSFPRYPEHFVSYTDLPHRHGLAAVLEIRAIPILAPPLSKVPSFPVFAPPLPVGWAILPLLDSLEESYTTRKAMILPMFTGTPSLSQLSAINEALISVPLSSVLAQLFGWEVPSHPSLIALGKAAFIDSQHPFGGDSSKNKRLRVAVCALLFLNRLSRYKKAGCLPLPHHDASVWPLGEERIGTGEGGGPPHPPLLRLLPFSASILARSNDSQLAELCAVPPDNYSLPALYTPVLTQAWKDGVGSCEYVPPPPAPPYYSGSMQELKRFALEGAIPQRFAGHPSVAAALGGGKVGDEGKGGGEGEVGEKLVTSGDGAQKFAPPPFSSMETFEASLNAFIASTASDANIKLLEESEKVRREQEEVGPLPPSPKPAAARQSYVARVWLYWIGEWDGGKLRTLCQEVYFGTPANALFAAVAVLFGSLASLKKAQARGAMLDIMAMATTSTSVATLSVGSLIESSAMQRLWGWKEGWGGLRVLAFWTLMEWCFLVGKDILLGLARTERGAQSRAVYFASMLRQDMAFHASHPSGELAARLDSDPKVLDELCVHGPERLLQGLVALGTLVWLLAVDPVLLALALCLRLPQLLQVTEMSVRLATAYERLADTQAAKAQARAADCLANVRVIQAHTSEKGEVAGYCNLLSERLRVVRSSAIISPLLRHSEGLVLLVTECALLAFGGLRVMSGSQTLGVFTSRRETTNSVVENFHGLEHVYHMVRRCGLLCGRYLGLRDRVPTIPLPLPIPFPLSTPLVGALPNQVLEGLAKEESDIKSWEGDWEGVKRDGSVQQIQGLRFRGEGKLQTPFSPSSQGSLSPPSFPPRGDITFENVSFSYPVPSSSDASSRNLVLTNVSFHIPGGSVCAFVGPSGGGKTTAGRLLARFYDVTQGRILLDGVDIRDIPVPLLRSWIGLVDQDTTLLSRSVKDNVTLGYKGAGSGTGCVDDEAPLRSALDGALASEFVDVLEGGWNAHVGERGGGLSGGQKQRLALSRLLLRNPPVAVIDEGTSALDTHCEASIMANLLSSSTTRNTRILIAHRYASIQAATMIVVFSGGVIVECGSPTQLLSKGGMFASLVATQIHK